MKISFSDLEALKDSLAWMSKNKEGSGKEAGSSKAEEEGWWSGFAWIVHKASHTGREPTVMLSNRGWKK